MRIICVLAMVAGVMSACGGEVLSLNGLWDFDLAEDRTLEETPMPAFVATDKMPVPGCWDAMSKYFNASGTGRYRTRFSLNEAVPGAFLCIEGAGLRSRFWIDGREVGFSKLPWTMLEFETGPLAAGEHELVAAVDNSVDAGKVKLFHDYYDFYPFGGFHHGVWLELRKGASEPRRVVVRTRDYRTGLVELEVRWAGTPTDDFTAEIAFDDHPYRTVAFRDGRAKGVVPSFRLWTPEHPNLHTVRFRKDGVSLSARFGIRQVSTADGRITLNGEPVYLQGVNRHESHFEFGCSTPEQIMYEDVRNVKDLGGNFIRGSHYAQCGRFLDFCDEMGILVWEESLGWGNGKSQFADAEFCDLQEEQTRIMVRTSINHPCVIISAFLNEPDSREESCRRLVDRLIDAIRSEDTGHLVTFACNRVRDDIANAKTDLIAYNVYPCWYSYPLKKGDAGEMRANIRRCHGDVVAYFRGKYADRRPIIVSETGVKADYGAHDPRGKAQYTEEFQDEYERLMLEEIFARKELAGIAIWQFTDAKTYTRKAGLVGRSYGVNTGGLYDLYRRPKRVVESVRRLFREHPVRKTDPFPQVSAPRRVTDGPHEHLLASYFGIDAWSPDSRRLLVLETDLNGRLPEVDDPALLGVVDLGDGNRFIPVARTVCWNFQEAAMGHWLDNDTVLYNDLRDGRFVTVVRKWRTGEERLLPMPVSAVSPDGKKAVCLNYARIRVTRCDYGYPGEGQDAKDGVAWPEDDGLWLMDLATGEARLIVSVASCRDRMPPIRKAGGLAYFCHTVFSRDGSRIFWLARTIDFFDKKKKIGDRGRQTTAFTCRTDGSDVRRSFPDGWGGSHFNWKDDRTICVTADWDGRRMSHVEYTVGEEAKAHTLGKGRLDWDGHCVYSPDGRWMSTEGYWDERFLRHWSLLRLADGETADLGSFFVPEPYRGIYWRCDLHARWRKDGRQLAFNSVHEGSRQVYVRDVKDR